jgi:hypothetical protein
MPSGAAPQDTDDYGHEEHRTADATNLGLGDLPEPRWGPVEVVVQMATSELNRPRICVRQACSTGASALSQVNRGRGGARA